MTYAHRVAANRRNGQKSRGPRTAAGKFIASRNALKHGLTAVLHRDLIPSAELEKFARALCDKDDDPALLAQARIIANNDVVLRAVTAQQIAVVERCREPAAIALARGDKRLALARARVRKGKEAEAELRALIAKLLEKYKDELPPPEPDLLDWSIVPIHLEGFLEDKEANAAPAMIEDDSTKVGSGNEAVWERNESAALEEAALDLEQIPVDFTHSLHA